MSFLNWLTILPSLATLDDKFLSYFFTNKKNSTLQNLLKYQSLKKQPDSELNKDLAKQRNVLSKLINFIKINLNLKIKIWQI